MSEMTLIALLFGAFAGFVTGIMLGSPRFGFVGSLWGDLYEDVSDLGGYLIDLGLGLAGAVIGLIIAALIVLYL